MAASSLPDLCGVCASERQRKAVVICVDGLRPDALLLAAPSFLRSWMVAPGSSFTFHARCDDVPVSLPSWSSTFTGTAQTAHGMSSNAEMGGPASSSVMHRLKAHDPSLSTALYVSGWWGLRNIFSNQQLIPPPRADTFLWKSTDASHVSGIVDHIHSYSMDESADGGAIPPGGYRGDAQAAEELALTIEATGGCDLNVIYLYDVDRIGHFNGFGPQVAPYVTSIECMITDKVARLLEAVAARQAAMSESEEWMVIVTTDHGGSARASMEQPVTQRFDALRGGDAYGQRQCEGVHGLASLRAHTNTVLLVRVPAHVDSGGEILDDDVRNSDVTPTLLHWFGAEYGDLQGKPRGVGLGKDFKFDLCKKVWCDQRCCSSKHTFAARKRQRG